MRKPIARAVDAALEATIVGSFTNVGSAIRRRTDNWLPLPSLAGRTVAITGGNSGLGYATCLKLAQLQANVVLIARNADRGEAAVANLRAAVPGAQIALRIADISDLSAVHELALELDDVDVLVHNAGSLAESRAVTSDGIEQTLATHVVGPFLLTALLLGSLLEHNDARVISVASGGLYAQRIDLRDLQSNKGTFNGSRTYARAKRAQVMLTREWARRLSGTLVTMHAMHPGWADTPGVQASLPQFATAIGPLLRTPAEGADTIAWLATADEPRDKPGLFWHDRRPRSIHRLPTTRADDRLDTELFAAIRELSGFEGQLPGD